MLMTKCAVALTLALGALTVSLNDSDRCQLTIRWIGFGYAVACEGECNGGVFDTCDTGSFVDGNGDGICNNNETFDDANGNNVRDLDSGVTGQGGAKDVTIYTVTLRYNRIFPMAYLLGWSQQVTMASSTILRNQPFDKQSEPLTGNCI